ncbi:MAG: hypothetical protein KatS3mg099_317 [Candidatus Parcubacteria bacterium]|nr:MAG: hypothetical protein KatS3mg099_317 [Candidatus Parcubacteria bacterium]
MWGPSLNLSAVAAPSLTSVSLCGALNSVPSRQPRSSLLHSGDTDTGLIGRTDISRFVKTAEQDDD